MSVARGVVFLREDANYLVYQALYTAASWGCDCLKIVRLWTSYLSFLVGRLSDEYLGRIVT